jgi:hypothetical protein
MMARDGGLSGLTFPLSCDFRPIRVLVAALALAAGGCYTPPVRVDTIAELKAAQGPAPDSPFLNLNAALVLSKNTKTFSGAIGPQSRLWAQCPMSEEACAARGYASGAAFVKKVGYPDRLVEALRRDFKSAVVLDGIGDLKDVRADVVVVVDLDYVLTDRSWNFDSGVTFDSRLIVLTPNKGEIDTLRDKATSDMREVEGKQCPDKMVSVFHAGRDTVRRGDCITDAIRDAFAASTARLESALRSSEKLLDYAQSAGKGAPAASAASKPVNERMAPAPSRLFDSDVDRPSYPDQEEHPDDFALVVGVEAYDSLPPADFAERDARAVRDHLLAMGFPQQNVIYLTGRKATRTKLAQYLESWLPKNVTERSRVFFYYSGHGAPDTRNGTAYLVPFDGDPRYLEQSAYPVKLLYRQLGALKAKEVVVALDACFSGAGGRSVLEKGARPLVTQVDTGAAAAKNARLVALAAAGDDEITGTAEEQGHGLFTYFLLKGLNELSGKPSVKQLYDFLAPKVRDAAKRANRDQTPRLIGSIDQAAQIRLK